MKIGYLLHNEIKLNILGDGIVQDSVLCGKFLQGNSHKLIKSS